jgi:cobalt-zinc-cadmium efflux system outer membrane protein
MLKQVLMCALLVGASNGVIAAEEEIGAGSGVDAGEGEAAVAPADRLVASVSQVRLRQLLRDVLERNPEIAVAEARARAAALRAPQVRAKPDPVVGLTAFILPPETRVGPQKFSAGYSQTFPWHGQRGLAEQRELQRAAVVRGEVEAIRLRLVTETRRLYYEIGFLDALDQVVQTDRATLAHYEELARSRYASGIGLQQAVIKIQAEITMADSRVLEIADRRATLTAAVNTLRNSPNASLERVTPLLGLPEYSVDVVALRSRAFALRPELASADAEIARSETLIELAQKESKPDIKVGLSYTYVGNRNDPAGQMNPPPDNGDDILALTAAINLPFRRKSRAAGVEEAVEIESASQRMKQLVVTRIDRGLSEFSQRIELSWKQLRLFEDVLLIQAEQSLLSAEAGYSTGSQGALDLLDAERVLLEVRTGTERNRADYAIAIARLEGALGEPLMYLPVAGEETDDK